MSPTGEPIDTGILPSVSRRALATNSSPLPSPSTNRRCTDPLFALLFYGGLAGLATTANLYGREAAEQLSGHWPAFATTAIVIGWYSLPPLILAGMFVCVMGGVRVASPHLIQTCLVSSLCMMTLIDSFVIMLGASVGWIMMLMLILLYSLLFTCEVWSRTLRLASTKLMVVAAAISAHGGICLVGLTVAVLSVLLNLLWNQAVMGVLYHQGLCDGVESQVCTIDFGALFYMLAALYYLQLVLQYSLHVVMAGLVGAWWRSSSDGDCCGWMLFQSTFRSVTTSFGSICFGCLLVPLAQVLLLSGLMRVCVGCQRRLPAGAHRTESCRLLGTRYWNQWTFAYVGLHGTSYLEGSRRVFDVMESNDSEWGWTLWVERNVLNTSFLLGIMVAGCSWLIIGLNSGVTLGETQATIIVGFVMTAMMTSLVLSVAGGGIHVVNVLLAEAPEELERNHPQLYRRIQERLQELRSSSN